MSVLVADGVLERRGVEGYYWDMSHTQHAECDLV